VEKIWFNIFVNKIDNKTTDIFIDGIIGGSIFEEDPITSKEFIKAFNKIDTPNINLMINSVGGNVVEGFAIYNTIKASTKNIESHIIGSAFSIASIIALAADKVFSPINTLWLIHEAEGSSDGTQKDLRKSADVLEKVTNQMVDIYAAKTGKDKSIILKDLEDETVFTGTEAFEYGLVDEVTPALEMVAFVDDEIKNYKSYKNIKKYLADLQNVSIINKKPENKKEIEIKKGKIMNLEQLETDHPKLVEQIKSNEAAATETKIKEAVAVENKRIADIKALENKDNKEIIDTAIEKGSTLEATGLLLIQDINAKKKIETEKLIKKGAGIAADGVQLATDLGEVSNELPIDVTAEALELKNIEIDAKAAVDAAGRGIPVLAQA